MNKRCHYMDTPRRRYNPIWDEECVRDLALSPDRETLVVATYMGVWVYELSSDDAHAFVGNGAWDELPSQFFSQWQVACHW